MINKMKNISHVAFVFFIMFHYGCAIRTKDTVYSLYEVKFRFIERLQSKSLLLRYGDTFSYILVKFDVSDNNLPPQKILRTGRFYTNPAIESQCNSLIKMVQMDNPYTTTPKTITLVDFEGDLYIEIENAIKIYGNVTVPEKGRRRILDTDYMLLFSRINPNEHNDTQWSERE